MINIFAQMSNWEGMAIPDEVEIAIDNINGEDISENG